MDGAFAQFMWCPFSPAHIFTDTHVGNDATCNQLWWCYWNHHKQLTSSCSLRQYMSTEFPNYWISICWVGISSDLAKYPLHPTAAHLFCHCLLVGATNWPSKRERERERLALSGRPSVTNAAASPPPSAATSSSFATARDTLSTPLYFSYGGQLFCTVASVQSYYNIGYRPWHVPSAHYFVTNAHFSTTSPEMRRFRRSRASRDGSRPLYVAFLHIGISQSAQNSRWLMSYISRWPLL